MLAALGVIQVVSRSYYAPLHHHCVRSLIYCRYCVYYQCAKNSQRKAEVEQNQPSAAAIPAARISHRLKMKLQTSMMQARIVFIACICWLRLLGVLVALGGIYAIWKQTEATAQATDAGRAIRKGLRKIASNSNRAPKGNG